MKKLKNWDNKTWLSSRSYISQFNKFLKLRVNLNKNSKILDIGCGRANIISSLHKKYKFKNKPVGIDIVRNKDIKKNIIFKDVTELCQIILNTIILLKNDSTRCKVKKFLKETI